MEPDPEPRSQVMILPLPSCRGTNLKGWPGEGVQVAGPDSQVHALPVVGLFYTINKNLSITYAVENWE